MRIHIGHISSELAERINELEQRLDRYGQRKSPISLHKKEFGSFYFAFVDMDIDQKQYAALCKSLNGVLFRRSRLEVKLAKPLKSNEHTIEGSKSDQGAKSAAKLNPDQQKRTKSVSPRLINVYPGRMMEVTEPRRNPTFRIRINGDIRKPKMRKRKLWGIEKRPLSKLSHYFEDGEWRDSEGKAVELVAALSDEHARDLKIAEDFANANTYLSDSEFEDFKEIAKDIGHVETDDEIEVVPKNASSHNEPVSRTARLELDDSSDSDDNEEGGHNNSVDQVVEVPASNTTEALRSALSADTPFTLFGTQTEDVEMDQLEESAPVTAALEQTATIPVDTPKVGLFFPHADSPYLRSQSQAAKLVESFDAAAWEKEFFENRGEWNRALRKRRRDAARMARRMGKKHGEL